MSTLLSIPPGVSPLQQEYVPQIPPSSAPIAASGPCLSPGGDTTCLTGCSPLSPLRDHLQSYL